MLSLLPTPSRTERSLAVIKTTALPGISYWSRPQQDRGIDFNGFHWKRESGSVLIDPMEVDEAELAVLRERGGARWILLSNFDHLRATEPLKRLLGAEVLAPAGEHDRFAQRGGIVDHWFQSSADLPDDLRPGVGVYPIPGGKSEVEMAFLLKEPKALVFGDVVRSHASGRLNLLPDPKVSNKKALVSALRALGELDFDGLLLGDGDNLVFGGKRAYAELLARLG
jgi:glyoxylase-like metal-dependent hydrolase (beta-lactamase superfamily II)